MFEKEKIAIDITSEKISIIIGTKTRVKSAVILETPNGTYEDDTIVDINKLKEIINPYSSKTKSDEAYFVVRGDDLIVRTIKIPVMKEEAMLDSVKWELSQFVGERVDDYIVSYRLLEKHEDGIGEVLMAAVPKIKLKAYSNLAKELGLKIKGYDVPSNLISNVFSNLKDSHKKGLSSIGVIDLGANYTLMEVIEKGRLKYEKYQSFGMASAALTRLQSNAEYLEMLQEVDLTNTEVINTFNDGRLQNLLDSITNQFKTIIQFSAKDRVKKDLDKVFILGSGMETRGIGRYLERILNVPIAQIPNFDGINFNIKTPEGIALHDYLYVYGLMLRGKKNELNFVFEDKNIEDVVQLRKKSSVAVIGLTIILIAGAYCYVQGKKIILERKRNNYISEIESKKELSDKDLALNNEITLLTSYINKAEQVEQYQTKETKTIIDNLKALIPSNVKVNSLAYGDNEIYIHGTAKIQNEIEELWANLRESEKYSDSHITNRKPVTGGYEFTLNIKLSINYNENEVDNLEGGQ